MSHVESSGFRCPPLISRPSGPLARIPCLPMERRNVRFESKGQGCAGWFYLPKGTGPFPAVVMAHGFGLVKGGGLPAYAERFVNAGFAVLSFDYRHFGESDGEPRQVLDIGKQLDDWRAAVAYARSLPEIDASRLALWGTSFSGGHVLTIAAEDPAIAAVISQVPFTDGLTAPAATGLGLTLRLSGAAMLDAARALFGAAPLTVPIVGAPGTLAAMTQPGSEEGYHAIADQDPSWKDEVAARVFLSLALYRPGRKASRVRCPLLVCVGENDRVTLPEPAYAAASRAPRGELVRYPIGHFDIYSGSWFETAVRDQLAFLEKHVGERAAAAVAAINAE